MYASELLPLSRRARAVPLVFAMSAPMRRLRVKTKMQKRKQVPLATLDDWESEEKTGSRRQVYLVTFPHPRASHSACGKKLVAPGSMTKKQVLECLLDAADHPEYTDGRSLSLQRKVALRQCGIWRELHQPTVNGAVCPTRQFSSAGRSAAPIWLLAGEKVSAYAARAGVALVMHTPRLLVSCEVLLRALAEETS